MKKKKIISFLSALISVFLFLNLFNWTVPSVSAQTSDDILSEIDELKEEADEIASKKETLEQEIENASAEQASVMDQKAAIDQQMNLTIEEINNTNALIEQYQLLLNEKQEQLDIAVAAETALYSEYKVRLREMEESGTVSYLSILFGAENFSDFLDRLEWVQEINEADHKMMKELNAVSDTLRVAQEELEAAQGEMNAELDTLETQKAELTEESEQQQILMEQLSQKTDEMLAVQAEYDQREEQIMKDIADSEKEYQKTKDAEEEAARIRAAEQAAAAAEQKQQDTEKEDSANTDSQTGNESNYGTDSTSGEQNNSDKTDTDADSGNTGAGTSGNGNSETSQSENDKDTDSSDSKEEEQEEEKKISFIRPVSGGKISSPFGTRTDPITGATKTHYGIDYDVSAGTPVKATASGTVILASYDSDCGNWVKISHQGGYTSIYMHMQSYCVHVGQTVVQGQVIGYVGSTGRSTGAHLHFGMLLNGSYINPASCVGAS